MGPPRLPSQIRQLTSHWFLFCKDAADQSQAHRKELLDIMTSFIPIKSVRFSKRLASVEQGPDGVTLTFGDGTTAQATVLAGSDGIQSTVREHVLGERYPSQVAPVYAGAYCYRGVIPIEEAYEILGDLTDVAKTYYGKKRGAVTYRISEGRVGVEPLGEGPCHHVGVGC